MIDRERSTCDIAQGSTWTRRDGKGSALVATVNLGFVVYEDESGRMRVTHHLLFRRSFEPPYGDRGLKDVKDWFHTNLANLANFHVFWSAREKRTYARSAVKTVAACYLPSRGRGGAVPAHAIYIGTYSVPFSPDDFVKDLNAELAARRTLESAAA